MFVWLWLLMCSWMQAFGITFLLFALRRCVPMKCAVLFLSLNAPIFCLRSPLTFWTTWVQCAIIWTEHLQRILSAPLTRWNYRKGATNEIDCNQFRRLSRAHHLVERRNIRPVRVSHYYLHIMKSIGFDDQMLEAISVRNNSERERAYRLVISRFGTLSVRLKYS